MLVKYKNLLHISFTMKTLIFFMFAISTCCAFANIDYKKFINPPNDCKPWTYWLWLNGNVDKQTITKDLEAMKNIGL